MKRFLFVFLSIICVLHCNAQSFCHNDDNDYENLLADFGTSFINYVGPYHVRVYFHIIRTTNGTGAFIFPSTYIPSCMNILNNDYNNHNIFFDYAGQDYIDNSVYYNLTSLNGYSYNNLINTNVHTDAIDIYLLSTQYNLGGKANEIPGRALAIGGITDGMPTGVTHVLSHEMGHCLGLFHTFHGGTSEPYGCAELVDGSNCAICGDYVCDTPADPFPLFNVVNSECDWLNTQYRDYMGQLYHPDTRQIMAYVSPQCMEHFSNGQGERMRAHIATQSILQDRITSSIVYIQDQQFTGNSTEIITAYDSIIAGCNVTSGTIGNVIVSSNADVTFEAGKKIILRAGFQVDLGSAFQARINTTAYPNNSQHTMNRTLDYLPLLENTQWTSISYGFEPPVMATISKTIGDTVIGENVYKIVQRLGINTDDGIVLPNIMETQYLYENPDKKQIYVYDQYEKKDKLLYNFSLRIGDILPNYSEYTLVEISNIENSGYTRRQYVFTNALSDSIIWIEGIGNNTDLLNSMAINRPNISKLLCVHNNDNVIYDKGTFRGYSCDDIDAIFEEQSIEDPHITTSTTKILRNGQLFIRRGDKTYTAAGLEIK